MFQAPAGNQSAASTEQQTPAQKQEAEAAAKFDQQGGRVLDESGNAEQQPQGQPQGDRPAWLPEKFKSPEDMARAYAELEGKQSQKQPQKEPGADKKDGEQPPAQSAEGINFDAMAQEITASGDISAQSRALLKKAGIPDAIVQSHIDNVKAQVATLQGAIHEAAGGKDQFEAMRQWATSGGLTEAERAFLGDQAAKGPEQAKIAVGQLHDW